MHIFHSECVPDELSPIACSLGEAIMLFSKVDNGVGGEWQGSWEHIVFWKYPVSIHYVYAKT